MSQMIVHTHKINLASLGGGFQYFSCSPLVGEDSHFWLIFFKGVETTNQIKFTFVKCFSIHFPSNPIGSMYGIFTYIWLTFMVNAGRYTIHGSFGNVCSNNPQQFFSFRILGSQCRSCGFNFQPRWNVRFVPRPLAGNFHTVRGLGKSEFQFFKMKWIQWNKKTGGCF